VLSPEPLDLNTTIARMEMVLRQTLGAHVDIALRLEPNLPATMADRSQAENAVLNLSINARDAMPEGGQVTLETRLAELDDDYALHNPEVSVGRYIMIAVSDTGAGMTPDVLEHAFEPFFSTKDANPRLGPRPQHGAWLRQTVRRAREDIQRSRLRHHCATLSPTD
jgi:signal transduction histidine kinase